MTIPSEADKLLIHEYYEYSIRGQPVVLCQELVKRNRGKIKVLALDLERTLATSVFDITDKDYWIVCDRPYLFEFLEAVKLLFERVVIFTAVAEEVFCSVAKDLVEKKKAPSWFAEIEYISWTRKGKKDLSFIPGVEPHEALLVDDHRGYVHSGQLFQWIEIKNFESINYYWDYELLRVLGILELIQLNQIKLDRVLGFLEPFVDQAGSGIKRLWLYGSIVRSHGDSESVLRIAIETDPNKNIIKHTWDKSTLEKAILRFEHHFWMPVELVPHNPDTESFLIENTWQTFCAALTRTESGIEIKFPDLPGCEAFCPRPADDDGTFDRITLQTIEPASEALGKWLGKASPGDIPAPKNRLLKKDFKKKYPELSCMEVSGQVVTPEAFWKTKKYQGKIRYVTLYRERISEIELEKLKVEFPDILIVDSFVFWFLAYETWPVERRFGCFEEFRSSFITRIDRKAGRIGALRRWWHVEKIVDGKSCIDRDLPEIDLAGGAWEPMDLPDDRQIEYLSF